jgi:hypothetical protein
MKQLLFGLHLPVMEFSSGSSNISNNSGSNNNKKNGEKEKRLFPRIVLLYLVRQQQFSKTEGCRYNILVRVPSFIFVVKPTSTDTIGPPSNMGLVRSS